MERGRCPTAVQAWGQCPPPTGSADARKGSPSSAESRSLCTLLGAPGMRCGMGAQCPPHHPEHSENREASSHEGLAEKSLGG